MQGNVFSESKRQEVKDMKKVLYEQSFLVYICANINTNKKQIEECQGCPRWHVLTERVNKRHCGMERQENPTSVLDEKKKNTDWGGGARKRNRFQSPHSAWRQEVKRKRFWQGVLVGFAVWLWGWRRRCVFAWKPYGCLCSTRVFSFGLTSARVCVCSADRGCWVRAHGSRGGRHPAVCQSAGWRMTTFWTESVQHNSQRGRVVIAGKNCRGRN